MSPVMDNSGILQNAYCRKVLGNTNKTWFSILFCIQHWYFIEYEYLPRHCLKFQCSFKQSKKKNVLYIVILRFLKYILLQTRNTDKI